MIVKLIFLSVKNVEQLHDRTYRIVKRVIYNVVLLGQSIVIIAYVVL